jgi:CelD/BcsL family acetyltransferase involved in cellulose biosynthesis
VTASSTQTRNLTCRLITDFAELQLLAREWDLLWEANPTRQIFSKFSWIESWWQGYGANARLLAPAVFENGTCIGILPLMVEGRVVRFVGDPATDYNDLLCDPERAPRVFEAAIRALDEAPVPWDFCALDNVSEASLILGARNDLAEDFQRRIESSVSALCPAVALGEGRDETLKAILGKSTVTRRIRQLQKLGTLAFRLLDDRDQARRHLPSFYLQHIRCRALAGIRSQLIDQESRDFFAALVHNLDPKTDLRFSVLELGERPIAYNFGFELDGSYIFYTPTYDVEFFDLSPGEVLLRYLFIYAQENGLREFDFTVGDESYKSRYANQTKRNYAMRLYPKRTRGRVVQAAQAAKERLRSHPALFRAAKSTASAATALAGRISTVVRRDGVVSAASKIAVRLFRAVIYARDEVLVLTSDGESPGSGAHGALSFRPATMSDLADAAVAYPEYLGGETLHTLRERIKKGHTPFVALDDGTIVHVIWLRVEDRIATTELGEDFALELGRPVGLLYDAWTPVSARGKGIYPVVVSLLAQHVRSQGLEPWIYVESSNRSSRRGLAKAGMSVRNRLIRHTWFRGLQRRVRKSTAEG